MTRCATAVTFDRLIAWWLGELDDEALEDHQFECPACTERVASIAAIAEALPDVVRRPGGRSMVLTAEAVERLERDGVRVRHYHFDARREVLCTVAPDDDLLVSWIELGATVAADERLDAVMVGPDGTVLGRFEDLPFDRARGRVVVADAGDAHRHHPDAVFRLQVTAVGATASRPLGEFVYRHSAWRA